MSSATAHNLHFLRNGKGVPLVLLHGYLGGAAQWQRQLSTLAKHFDVIAPELAGYGSSFERTAADSIAAYAEQVLQLLDSIGVEQFYLLGHSMGGMVVQEMVARAPERVFGLLCYGTGPHGLMPERYETLETSRARLREDGVPVTARRISAKWFAAGDKHPEYLATAAHGEHLSINSALAGLRAMETWDGFAALPSIQVPTLVLWGDQDQSYTWPQPETLWKFIKNSQLAVMPGCSHAAHVENPELFELLLTQFVQQHSP